MSAGSIKTFLYRDLDTNKKDGMLNETELAPVFGEAYKLIKAEIDAANTDGDKEYINNGQTTWYGSWIKSGTDEYQAVKDRLVNLLGDGFLQKLEYRSCAAGTDTDYRDAPICTTEYHIYNASWGSGLKFKVGDIEEKAKEYAREIILHEDNSVEKKAKYYDGKIIQTYDVGNYSFFNGKILIEASNSEIDFWDNFYKTHAPRIRIR
jgi:hypothetical protein